MIRPARSEKDLAPLLQFRYAHRGLYGQYSSRENTYEAFTDAIASGYGIELDVQLSADGTAVISHDRTLKRLFGIDHAIEDMSDEALAFLPTLKQTLLLVNGEVPLIIELKHYGDIYRTCKEVYKLLKPYQGPYAIESFHPLMLRWFLHNAPDVPRGQLLSRSWQLLFHCFSRPDIAVCKLGMEKALLLRFFKRICCPVTVAWTVRTGEEHLIAQAYYDTEIFESY
jgi:glycerophosphoryl diester phosphodiesterase